MALTMRRAVVRSIAVAVILLAMAIIAEAQQAKKVPRIGYLATTGSISTSPSRRKAFREGLRELGYSEGKNIVIEWRYAEGKLDRLPALAAELVHLKVDVIVTGGDITTRVVKKATSTIPIVMAQDTDPVANGFVASLSRPGGNITGFSTLSAEISGKRLELLKEIVPRLSRAAVFGTSTTPANARALRETEVAAEALGVQVQYLDVLGPKDFETAFRAVSKRKPDAVINLNSAVLNSHRKYLIDFAAKSRLPAMYSSREYVEDGGLMSYSANIPDLFRRAATYVDKILKGAKPGDLPIEQATKFEMAVNLKTAKKIGLTIPASVLLRADKVIK